MMFPKVVGTFGQRRHLFSGRYFCACIADSLRRNSANFEPRSLSVTDKKTEWNVSVGDVTIGRSDGHAHVSVGGISIPMGGGLEAKTMGSQTLASMGVATQKVIQTVAPLLPAQCRARKSRATTCACLFHRGCKRISERKAGVIASSKYSKKNFRRATPNSTNSYTFRPTRRRARKPF
jgi:hypothetical protein